jgi:hypothetical protein
MASQVVWCCIEHEFVTCARSLAVTQQRPATCFELVSYVLAKSTPLAYRELLEAHKAILKKLPPKHRSPFFIPYYYSLLPFDSLKYWKKVKVTDVQSGDLLVYIDEKYDPDPSSRAANAPSGTHIGFISDIIYHDKDGIKLSILDASKRVRGRCLYHLGRLTTPSKPGCIAYSFLNALHNPATDLWKLMFDNQRPLENKRLYALRVEEKEPHPFQAEE